MAKRVLLVDDEPSILKLFGAKLKFSGFDVTIAMDGVAALARVMESPPDVVILDVMLPKMNGFDVCTAIKQNPQLKRIPVVMFTALRDEQDYWKGMACGADAFVTKPQAITELEQIVNRVINALNPGDVPPGPSNSTTTEQPNV